MFVAVFVDDAVSSLIQETLQTPGRGEYLSSSPKVKARLGSEKNRELFASIAKLRVRNPPMSHKTLATYHNSTNLRNLKIITSKKV